MSDDTPGFCSAVPCILISTSDSPIDHRKLQACLLSLDRQGFERSRAMALSCSRLEVRFWPSEQERLLHLTTSEGEIVCIGPVWTGDGSTESKLFEAADALARKDTERAGKALRQLHGSFVIVFFLNRGHWIYTDPIGGMQLFLDRDQGLIGSSFLSLLEQQAHPRFERAGVLQYLLAEAPHGGRSIIQGIEVIPPGCLINQDASDQLDIWKSFWSPSDSKPASIQDTLEQLENILVSDFKAMRDAGLGRASIALSGGFDSRLVLGLAQRAGIQPDVFVYGPANSPDVRIASLICQAEGLSIAHVDKAVLNRQIPVPQSTDQSIDFFDGYSADGCLDPGADRLTRLQQTAEGRVALNGGGGEILRNFFHLGNGAFTAAQIVDAFYCQFPSSILRNKTDLALYRETMAQGIRSTLKTGTEKLERRQVELIYPLFRCRWWMSRNSSIANRTGLFLTPLLNPQVILMAANIDLHWKRAGRLEAALIKKVSPSLARHESAYGFRFDQGPGMISAIKERFHELRPTAARPLISASGYLIRNRSTKGSKPKCEDNSLKKTIRGSLFLDTAPLSAGIERRLATLQTLADRFTIAFE
jgi:asparagine synthase (glutamine-hydrolysing)